MGKNDGKDLLAVSFAVSSALAEGKTADEIGLLGAFFTVLGDSLALLSARTALCQNGSGTDNKSTDPKTENKTESKSENQ